MENWQIGYVKRKEESFRNTIKYSQPFLDKLGSLGILQGDEQREIEQTTDKAIKCKKFLDILKTRVNGYEAFRECLQIDNQVDALGILVEGDNESSLENIDDLTSIDTKKEIAKGCRGTKTFRGKMENIDVVMKRINSINYSLTNQDIVQFDALRNLEKHDNVLQLFRLNETHESKYKYLTIEMCTTSLNACVSNRHFHISRKEILRQASTGLEYLHQNDVKHMNLRPSNILIQHVDWESAIVKLSDYGMWRNWVGGGSSARNTYYPSCWMPKETLQTVDTKKDVLWEKSGDVFSLGCVFYYTITDGIHPYGTPTYCHSRILEGTKHLSILDNKVPECCKHDCLSLIREMIQHHTESRPTCKTILKHETFWSCNQIDSLHLSQDELAELRDKELTSKPKALSILLDEKKQLGSGASGKVYEGTFGVDPQKAAVKVVDITRRRLAVSQITSLKKCKGHDNVIRYFDSEEQPTRFLIAMELCQYSLHDKFNKTERYQNGVQDRLKELETLLQITAGLNHLHDLKIIHCDLKPSNVLFFNTLTSFVVKISDFGLSMNIEDARNSISCSTPWESSGWMAPEVLRLIQDQTNNQKTGKLIMNCMTDIFSLGCIFHYVLSGGKHPFGGYTVRTDNILDDKKILDLTLLDVRCNSLLITKMLDKNSQGRPTVKDILLDTVFWDNTKKLNFIAAVTKYVKNVGPPKEGEQPSLKQKCIQKLSDAYQHQNIFTASNGWYSKILINVNGVDEGAVVQNYFITRRKGNKNTMIGLVRQIKNSSNHSDDRDVPTNVTHELGTVPDTYMEFWLKRFPDLIHHLKEAFSDCMGYEEFRLYYYKE